MSQKNLVVVTTTPPTQLFGHIAVLVIKCRGGQPSLLLLNAPQLMHRHVAPLFTVLAAAVGIRRSSPIKLA